jgi:hypothetical protein
MIAVPAAYPSTRRARSGQAAYFLDPRLPHPFATVVPKRDTPAQGGDNRLQWQDKDITCNCLELTVWAWIARGIVCGTRLARQNFDEAGREHRQGFDGRGEKTGAKPSTDTRKISDSPGLSVRRAEMSEYRPRRQNRARWAGKEFCARRVFLLYFTSVRSVTCARICLAVPIASRAAATTWAALDRFLS